MKEVREILDEIAGVVLAYRPKERQKKPRKRKKIDRKRQHSSHTKRAKGSDAR
jgi:hypothetical protein